VATSANGFPIPPWIGDNSVSAWIGPNSDGQLNGPVGLYDYRTTFTLSSPGLVTITGQWASDNEGPDILLNGISTGNSTTNQFLSFTPFTITGLGVAGVNTLDFLVNNDGGPTGLRVEFFSANVIPEPGSLALFGMTTVAGALYCGWRRKRATAVV
jgi:hypothetical protein